MKRKILSYLTKRLSTNVEGIGEDEKATFILMYNELHIGTLEFESGIWTFEYSPFFKQTWSRKESSNKEENILAPIFAFPDVDKKYNSTELWPFFAARIPGLKQPKVQAIMRSSNILGGDLVALLTQFGRKTIINPFELIPQ